MFSRTSGALALALGLGVAVGACDNGVTGSESSHIRIALTDAPLAMFDEAKVQIGEISLIPEDEGPPVVLTSDGGEHDLLSLQDGVTADLADLEIDPGTYVQLRLQVLSAEVTLADPYEFDSEPLKTRPLQVPSGAETGIKVDLRFADGDSSTPGVELGSGESAVVVLDMDVSQNFVLLGDPDSSAGLQDVLFTPEMRAVLESVSEESLSGSISGTVTYGSAIPDEPAERAAITGVITSIHPDYVDELPVDASTVAGEDGTYTIWYLPPGTYKLRASATIDGEYYESSAQEVTVGEGEAVEGVNFTL